MYLGMSAMLERDIIANEVVIRYLTGHPVSTATLILFFVGVGSLLMIATNVFAQWGAANRIHFRDPSSEPTRAENDDENQPESSTENEQPCIDQAIEFGNQLLKLPKRFRDHYLWQRLHESLHFVHRTGSAKGLEDETKYLSELDLDQQQQRYSLVRILIWATPMLGFLGTVLGISQALGGINVGPENDFQEMMGGLRASLYVAFDTTALALVLSMVLMFGQFLVDRIELQLLKFVDYRTRQELSARFDMSAASEFAAVEKMGLAVLATADELVQRQSALWHKSISAAEKAWADSITGVNERVRDNLSSALDQSVEKITATIGNSIQKADDSMAHRWQQWQVTLSDSARNMKEQQRELNSQTQLIKDLVDSVTVKVLDPPFEKRVETTETIVAAALESHRQPAATVESVDLTESDTLAAHNDDNSQATRIYFAKFTEEIPADSPAASEADVPESADAFEDSSPDVVIPPGVDLPLVRLFHPEDHSGKEPRQDVESEHSEPSDHLPRYRYAEQLAGVDPVDLFPVQIDSKKAA